MRRPEYIIVTISAFLFVTLFTVGQPVNDFFYKKESALHDYLRSGTYSRLNNGQ